MLTARTSENEYWQEHHDITNIAGFNTRLTKHVPPIEWLVINNMKDYDTNAKRPILQNVITTAVNNCATQIFLSWNGRAGN